MRRNLFVKKCKHVSLWVPLAQVTRTAPDLDVEEADAGGYGRAVYSLLEA